MNPGYQPLIPPYGSSMPSRSFLRYAQAFGIAGLLFSSQGVIAQTGSPAAPAEPEMLAAPAPAIVQVQAPEPVQPVQPPSATEPSNVPLPIQPSAGSAAIPAGIFGSIGGSTTGGSSSAPSPISTSGGALSASQQAAPATGSSVVGGGEATARASSDLGDLLGKSISAIGVEVHNRSPIITEPFIRGYHIGQYVTQVDGGFWMPARQDLDTIVSKIDSSQIENVVIIKGPYSVRYGPGFSFLDVQTLDTPRYQNGPEVHGSTGLTYKTNENGWFGLQSFWGGGETSGFRVTYSDAFGSDYVDGSNRKEPSSFHSQTFSVDYGWNWGQYARFEIKGMHVDQPNVEIPGSFFDLNYLGSDAYTGRFIYEDRDYGKFTLDSWFNYTKLTGDNFGGAKRAQVFFFDDAFGFKGPSNPIPVPGVPYFVTTNAEMASLGYRSAFTLGGRNQPQITIGTDYTYLDGQSVEFDNAAGTGATNFKTDLPVPHSYSQDPGLFLDASLPLLENRLQIKAGMRFDWMRTAVSNLEPPPFPGTGIGLTPIDPTVYFPGFAFSGDQLRRDFSMWSAFITPEYRVNDQLTLLAGVGYAQRPPTLTELYALQPFMGVIQNGVNNVTGNPLLAPETLCQVDLGFKWNTKQFRAGVNGFYAFIHDYITYQNLGPTPIPPFPGSTVYQYANTNEATLAGGEMYAEWDVQRWLTLFGTLAYTEGRNLTLGSGNDNVTGLFLKGIPLPGPTGTKEPLPDIPPLDSRVGFRIKDPANNPRWAVEFTTHIVAAQDAVATSLNEQVTPGYTLFDLRAFWRPRDYMLITAGIENIGDKTYREWADLRTGTGVFQPGRIFYFGTRLTY